MPREEFRRLASDLRDSESDEEIRERDRAAFFDFSEDIVDLFIFESFDRENLRLISIEREYRGKIRDKFALQKEGDDLGSESLDIKRVFADEYFHFPLDLRRTS